MQDGDPNEARLNRESKSAGSAPPGHDHTARHEQQDRSVDVEWKLANSTMIIDTSICSAKRTDLGFHSPRQRNGKIAKLSKASIHVSATPLPSGRFGKRLMNTECQFIMFSG